jgi:hypothetical protein
MHERGLLGPHVTYVHCCSLSDEEFKIIADSGGTASLSVEVEMNMGHGNPATLRLLDAGVRPSISIDICTSVGGDMFTQMRILLAASRGLANARAIEERRILHPLPLTARDILDFATLQGAKACGLESKIGSLTPGKDADLVLIDTNAINLFPINNPIGAVVEAAHSGNVDTVIVQGQVLKRHGKLVHADLRSLRHRMENACDGLFHRSRAMEPGCPSPIPRARKRPPHRGCSYPLPRTALSSPGGTTTDSSKLLTPPGSSVRHTSVVQNVSASDRSIRPWDNCPSFPQFQFLDHTAIADDYPRPRGLPKTSRSVRRVDVSASNCPKK